MNITNNRLTESIDTEESKIVWIPFTPTCIFSSNRRFWIVKGLYFFSFVDDKTGEIKEFAFIEKAKAYAEKLLNPYDCPIAQAIRLNNN
jgi:hypothetical protein